VVAEHVEKSIGAEMTFDTDVSDPELIRRSLLALADKVGARLRAAGQVGRTVGIKVRLADFKTVNRSRTIPTTTDVAREIFEISWALFEALRAGDHIRLIGVRVEGLAAAATASRQLSLGEPERGWREAEAAADAVAARFGRSVVGPASLLGRSDLRRTENHPHSTDVRLSDPATPS
jgi:DNA polymerase-4